MTELNTSTEVVYNPATYSRSIQGTLTVIIWRCGHKHRKANIAKECAEKMRKNSPPDVEVNFDE